MHRHLIRTRIYMRIHIHAHPLASERKPASGRARLAAQGRKDGPGRVNPILKKIRKGDLQENFFLKNLENGIFRKATKKLLGNPKREFLGNFGKTDL